MYYGEGNGTPLQYSCLENPMGGGAWWAAVRWGRGESDTTKRLHFHFSLWCSGEGNGTPLQCSCLENPMGWGAWCAAVHGVAKSQTRLSDFTFTFHFHALEKEMATHSSVLAWRIPGTGAWWAAIYGVAQSRTWLKRCSSSSSSMYYTTFRPQILQWLPYWCRVKTSILIMT